VAIYVARRLRGDRHRAGGYGTAAWDFDLLVDVIGREIHDEVAVGNFLVAQFVVEEMLSIPVLADRKLGWSRSLNWPRQLQDWVQRDVERRMNRQAVVARAALAPVAHAQRGGLTVPLWRTLVPEFGVQGNADVAIANVIDKLGFYLVTVAPYCYSLRHQQFADYFTGHLMPGRGDQIFVDTLLASVARGESGGLAWQSADDYTALNLLTHAQRAGRLAHVVGKYPACLARVHLLSASSLLRSTPEPACRASVDVLHRASYAASASFGERAAALQTHAALAGYDALAGALLAQAGSQMPWSVPWWTGESSRGAVVVGPAERTQAAVAVDTADGQPASVVMWRTDGRCSLLDAATRQPISPDIVLDCRDRQDPPLLRAWQGQGGLIYVAVGYEDGEVAVWALTGRSAGTVIWTCSTSPQLRDLARVCGPRGTDLIVTLAGDSGVLAVWPMRPFMPRTHDAGAPFGGISAPEPADRLISAPCAATRVIGLDPTDEAAAFLTAGSQTELTAWRIPSGPGVVQIHRQADPRLRNHAVLAVGNADRACLVVSDGDAVYAGWLTASLSVAHPLQRLADGGRTSPVTLAGDVHAATVAIADSTGLVQAFDLNPDVPAVSLCTVNTDGPAHHLAILDRDRAKVAVASWGAAVAIVDLRGNGPTAVLNHGEPTVTVQSLGHTDDGLLLVTRGRSGLTRIWQLATDRAGGEAATTDRVLPITALSTASANEGRALLLAAGSEGRRVQRWIFDHSREQVHSLPDLVHNDVVTALKSVRIQSQIWVAAASATGLTAWKLSLEGAVLDQSSIVLTQPDLQHLAIAADRDGRIVIITAGEESLRACTIDDIGATVVHASEEEWVTAFTAEQVAEDRFVIVTGNDDGAVRVIDLANDGLRSRLVHEGLPVAAATALTVGNRLIVVSADRYGGLTVCNGDEGSASDASDIDTLPWHMDMLLAVPVTGGARLFGVAVPLRVFLWEANQDGHLRLARQAPGLKGAPLYAAHNDRTVAVADNAGQVLFTDAITYKSVEARLNINVDALVHLPGSNWFVAAHDGSIVVLRADSLAESSN
jgi:hypothetical protein